MAIPQPDPALLRAAQGGDQAAFSKLVAAYHQTVFNYVLRSLNGDRALAEDLCQEIFLRVYQGLPKFSMRCRFTTWLFQIAKNRVLDEMRARDRRGLPTVELDSVPNQIVALEPGVQAEEMDAVFRVIGGLQPDLRTALLMRDVVGLAYNEIAETLGISLATTKWRIYKAREVAAERLIAEGVLRTPPVAIPA